jgi:5-hydroxyisourate hydrolase-like protein (transthyretin family)
VYGASDPVLTGTLSGFLAGDGVTATYTRTPGETVAGSPYTISAALSPAGVLGTYQVAFKTAIFTITKGQTTVTAPTSSNASTTFGDAVTFTASALAVSPSAGIPTGTITFNDNGVPIPGGTAVINATGQASVTVTGVNAGSRLITATYSGDSNFFGSGPSVSTTQTVRLKPIVTWPTPAAVPVNTALSYTQLNATANTAGTFVYTPALGTVLNTAGTKMLSVTFTPTDTTLYVVTTTTVNINVVAAGTQTMTSTLTISTPSVQYSDNASFTVQVTSSVAGQMPAGKVAFKIGTQAMGVSNLTPIGDPLTTTTYQAVWSGPLLEPSPSGTPPTGQLKPSLKIVSAQMLDPDPRFAMTNPTNKSMTIAVEDARVAYAGASTTLTLSGGTVPLTASVTELADGLPGAITLATVQFVNRANNAVIGTAPVGPDGKATMSWTTTAGSYTIGFVVGNYYSRNNAADNVAITVK